jgi:hypothetical protein
MATSNGHQANNEYETKDIGHHFSHYMGDAHSG